MASIRHIAQRTGVSPATVSRALKLHPDISPETRRKVVMAANAVGYAVPSAARGETSVGVGVVVDSHRALSLYDTMLINGLRQGLHAGKLDVQFVDVSRDKAEEESFTCFFQLRGVRGAVVPPGADQARLVRAIHAEGFACVALGARFDEPGVDYVCCDAGEATARAVEHLRNLGHARIAIAVPPFSDHDHGRRFAGYREGLERCGLGLEPALTVRIDPAMEGGYAALHDLLSQLDPPTAILFADPYPAIGALARAHEAGLRVPGQLSIVGFDDARMRRQVYPLMTAVCQPTEELGRLAGEWLVEALAGRQPGPLRRVLPANLEINQTSGAPAAPPVRMQPDGTLLAGGIASAS